MTRTRPTVRPFQNRAVLRRFSAVLAALVAVGSVTSTVWADPAIYEQTLPCTTWVVAKIGDKISRGSGVLLDRERHLVVTNYHVVLDARQALVFFPYRKDGQVVAERDF